MDLVTSRINFRALGVCPKNDFAIFSLPVIETQQHLIAKSFLGVLTAKVWVTLAAVFMRTDYSRSLSFILLFRILAPLLKLEGISETCHRAVEMSASWYNDWNGVEPGLKPQTDFSLTLQSQGLTWTMYKIR